MSLHKREFSTYFIQVIEQWKTSKNMNPGAIKDSNSIFSQKGKAEEDAYIR